MNLPRSRRGSDDLQAENKVKKKLDSVCIVGLLEGIHVLELNLSVKAIEEQQVRNRVEVSDFCRLLFAFGLGFFFSFHEKTWSSIIVSDNVQCTAAF